MLKHWVLNARLERFSQLLEETEHFCRWRQEQVAKSVHCGEALTKASEFAGRKLPTTALTLLMRDGRPVYQAVGGMGVDSLLIDAESGAVIKTPPPSVLTRYFHQAHFYFFAAGWQVPLLVSFSALAFVSALSGLYLNLSMWFGRLFRRS